MPESSSRVKIAAVKQYGGVITFCESTLASRESTLAMIKQETGSVEIHPYNDYRIIAGQATAAKELLEFGIAARIGYGSGWRWRIVKRDFACL